MTYPLGDPAFCDYMHRLQLDKYWDNDDDDENEEAGE